MIDRLAANPESLAIGMATRGGTNHLGLAQAVKSAGIDPKAPKTVVFKTNVESLTGLVGGHLHVVTTSATAALPWVQKGQARMLAVLAPQRQGGPLANVPTLREQGFDVAGVTNWRGHVRCARPDAGANRVLGRRHGKNDRYCGMAKTAGAKSSGT